MNRRFLLIMILLINILNLIISLNYYNLKKQNITNEFLRYRVQIFLSESAKFGNNYNLTENDINKIIKHITENDVFSEQIDDLIYNEIIFQIKNRNKKDEGKKMKNYETIIILKEKITDEENQKIQEKIKDYTTQIKITKNLGVKRLAYSVRENKNGIYILYLWNGTQQECIDLEFYFRQEDNILKFITVSLSEQEFEESLQEYLKD